MKGNKNAPPVSLTRPLVLATVKVYEESGQACCVVFAQKAYAVHSPRVYPTSMCYACPHA